MVGIKTVAPGFIRTEFGANAKITTSESYQEYLDHFLGVLDNPELTKDGSTAEEVAAVVYEATTDGKEQVLQVQMSRRCIIGVYRLGRKCQDRKWGNFFWDEGKLI